MNSTMEKFRKSVNICQRYGQKYRGPFFDSHCMYSYMVGEKSGTQSFSHNFTK